MCKKLCLFLVLMLIVSTFTTVVLATQLHGTEQDLYAMYLEEQARLDADVADWLDEVHGETFTSNLNEAQIKRELLYRSFATNRSGDFMFPAFYGGTYYGADGNLVVLIVESSVECVYSHEVLGFLLESDSRSEIGISYRFVTYSFAELDARAKGILDIVMERRSSERDGNPCIYALNVSGTGIRTDLNKVHVHLIEYNEEMITGFRKHVYDSDILLFNHLGAIVLGGGASSSSSFLCYDYSDYSIYCNVYTYESYPSSTEPQPMSSITVNPIYYSCSYFSIWRRGSYEVALFWRCFGHSQTFISR